MTNFFSIQNRISRDAFLVHIARSVTTRLSSDREQFMYTLPC